VKALAIALALVAGILVPRTSSAETATEARARQVLIVLRVLAYDRALATRAPGDRVGVVITHDGSKAGRADAALWSAAFKLIPNVKAGGRMIRATELEVEKEAAFDLAVAQQRPALVIVAGAADVTVVRSVTRRRQALSFSMREGDVRAGIAFGLVVSDDGNEIVINLDAARSEGAKLGAGLLQLARLVEGKR
jgi:hypothetical protein